MSLTSHITPICNSIIIRLTGTYNATLQYMTASLCLGQHVPFVNIKHIKL